MAFINALYNLWPNGDQKVAGLRDGIAIAAPKVFAQFNLDSVLVVAHAMAQFSHECGAGHDMEENMQGYTAQRICQVWPSRFRSIESALPYAHNARGLANKVYNGRMGNRPGTDDGYNYRGRSLSQTTGRGVAERPQDEGGYAHLQRVTGLPLLDNPGMVNDPKHALFCGVADFIACGCLPWAKADNVGAVSAALNVGDPHRVNSVVGLPDRADWLRRWKGALGRGPLDLSLPAALVG